MFESYFQVSELRYWNVNVKLNGLERQSGYWYGVDQIGDVVEHEMIDVWMREK